MREQTRGGSDWQYPQTRDGIEGSAEQLYVVTSLDPDCMPSLRDAYDSSFAYMENDFAHAITPLSHPRLCPAQT